MEILSLIIPGFDRDHNDCLKITLQQIPDLQSGCLVNLKGFIDSQNSKFFEKQIQKIFENGYIKIILNCMELSYISSTGIGSISILLREIKLIGGEIVFLGIQPKVFEVFQMLGFSKFFTLTSSIEESVKYFKENTREVFTNIFPCTVECPMCKKKLRAPHVGKFRCANCKVIITVTEEGFANIS